MPNFARNFRQRCTYWAQTGTDQYNKPTFAAPVSYDCRWEDVDKLFIDKYGDERTSRSEVILATDINVEGYLLLGESISVTPLALDGIQEIKQVKRIPDLRGLQTMYVVYL